MVKNYSYFGFATCFVMIVFSVMQIFMSSYQGALSIITILFIIIAAISYLLLNFGLYMNIGKTNYFARISLLVVIISLIITLIIEITSYFQKVSLYATLFIFILYYSSIFVFGIGIIKEKQAYSKILGILSIFVSFVTMISVVFLMMMSHLLDLLTFISLSIFVTFILSILTFLLMLAKSLYLYKIETKG